jgi:hypothetical protein
LQADFLAGWYLGNRSRSNGYQLTEQDLESALRSFYESGDYEFTNAQHHGTPEQRVAAVSAGYSHSSLKFNEIYESSMEFIGDRGPLRKPSRALPFSPDEFESTLAKIRAKRSTGFAEFKGSPSPGMQFTWDATISHPSAKECSVVWSNEYQGEFDCTMAETFDVAIATSAWENLAAELRDEGWTATIEAAPIKERLKEANFKSTDGKELNLLLERKSLSTLPYRVDIEIPFDNY